MADSAVVPADDGVLVFIRVQPRASRNAVICEPDGRIRIALTAPPVDGEANAALLRFMARVLQVKRHQLHLRAGERGRDKVVFVQGGAVTSVRALLDVHDS